MLDCPFEAVSLAKRATLQMTIARDRRTGGVEAGESSGWREATKYYSAAARRIRRDGKSR